MFDHHVCTSKDLIWDDAKDWVVVPPQCTRIDLLDQGLGDVAVASLALELGSCPQVVFLGLVHNDIGPVGTAALAQLVRHGNLRRLDLNSNHLGDEGAAVLATALVDNASLEYLGLHNNGIGQAGARALGQALAENSNLRELNLMRNPDLGEEGVASLARGLQQRAQRDHSTTAATRIEGGSSTRPGVLRLNLGANRLTDQAALHLAAIIGPEACLGALLLSGNMISDVGMRALLDALESGSTTTELHLSANRLTDASVGALVAALPQTILRVVSLSGNQISRKGLLRVQVAVSAALTPRYAYPRHRLTRPNTCTVSDLRWTSHRLAVSIPSRCQFLDLGSSGLGDDDVSAIAHTLASGALGVAALNLMNNNITDAGAASLAWLLLSPDQRIERIELFGNRVGDKGARDLAHALVNDPHLKVLDLWDNGIGSEGGLWLAHALERNTRLVELQLCWNNMGEEATIALLDAVAINEESSVKTLGLWDTGVTTQGLEALSETLQGFRDDVELNLSGEWMKGVATLASQIDTTAHADGASSWEVQRPGGSLPPPRSTRVLDPHRRHSSTRPTLFPRK